MLFSMQCKDYHIYACKTVTNLFLLLGRPITCTVLASVTLCSYFTSSKTSAVDIVASFVIFTTSTAMSTFQTVHLFFTN